MDIIAWCLGCFLPNGEGNRLDHEEQMIEDLVSRALADEADNASGRRTESRVKRIWDVAPDQNKRHSQSSSSVNDTDVD